nr:MAG TPA_asm: hypothetical protein [Caudoviricetes sp.]DAQ50220.1 MAG TPA: hypothetical protein [Caudoviricetes sp.]
MILPVSRAQKQWMDRFGDMLPGSRAQKGIRLPKASSWSYQGPAEPRPDFG